MSSVEDIPAYGLKLFPNPATDHLTVEWDMGMKVQIDVFDMMGRKIDSQRSSGGRIYMDTSIWEEGIYFVQINRSETRKLIITR